MPEKHNFPLLFFFPCDILNERKYLSEDVNGRNLSDTRELEFQCEDTYCMSVIYVTY